MCCRASASCSRSSSEVISNSASPVGQNSSLKFIALISRINQANMWFTIIHLVYCMHIMSILAGTFRIKLKEFLSVRSCNVAHC